MKTSSTGPSGTHRPPALSAPKGPSDTAPPYRASSASSVASRLGKLRIHLPPSTSPKLRKALVAAPAKATGAPRTVAPPSGESKVRDTERKDKGGAAASSPSKRDASPRYPFKTGEMIDATVAGRRVPALYVAHPCAGKECLQLIDTMDPTTRVLTPTSDVGALVVLRSAAATGVVRSASNMGVMHVPAVHARQLKQLVASFQDQSGASKVKTTVYFNPAAMYEEFEAQAENWSGFLDTWGKDLEILALVDDERDSLEDLTYMRSLAIATEAAKAGGRAVKVDGDLLLLAMKGVEELPHESAQLRPSEGDVDPYSLIGKPL